MSVDFERPHDLPTNATLGAEALGMPSRERRRSAAEPVPAPSRIVDHQASGILEIAWRDGTVCRLAHAALRTGCRCAACEQAFRTHGVRTPAADGVRVAELHLVADRGLHIVFSDGHRRGLFPWDYLRALAAQELPDETAAAAP